MKPLGVDRLDLQADAAPSGHGMENAGLTVQFEELWRPDVPSQLPRGPEAILLSQGAISQKQLDAAKALMKERPQLTVMQALRQGNVITEE